MPEQLQSYAITLVMSILSAQDITPETPDDLRGKMHKEQTARLNALVTFLLDHYAASGYTADAIALAVRQAVINWTITKSRE